MIICTYCQKPKPKTAFHANAKNPNGLQSRCIDCNNHVRKRLGPDTKNVKTRIDIIVAINKECQGDPERVGLLLRERGLIPSE
jgi:hypothetical protein